MNPYRTAPERDELMDHDYGAWCAEIDLLEDSYRAKELYVKFHNARALTSYDHDHKRWYRWHTLLIRLGDKMYARGWKRPNL